MVKLGFLIELCYVPTFYLGRDFKEITVFDPLSS